MMQRRAYTLVELLLVLGFMGAIAMIAVPRLPWSLVDRTQTQATARMLVADLRRTRSIALSQAAQSPAGFRLLLTGEYPHAAYEIQNVHTGVVLDRHVVAPGVHVTAGGSHTFTFGPLGNLLDGSATDIAITGGGQRRFVRITPATGRVDLHKDS